jgi:SAM-dependent methyltransferase
VDLPVGFELLGSEPAALLRHEAIPFVSYPYEWAWGMLRDAALLQLELLLAALREGMVLKDSSPYNVQWRGAQPVFVDVGSFEELPEGEPWVGYRQFCMLYLYPLLLQAYRDVPHHPWLRGAIDGITPEQCRNLLAASDLRRPGVLTHVRMHARLEARHGDRADEVKGDLRAAGFKRELIEANVRGLQKLLRRLEWDPPSSVWTEYGRDNSYSEEDGERKRDFVRDAARSGSYGLCWDLGCNDGTYSRIALEGADYVVAVDGDHGLVELNYRALRDEGETRILPLTMNLADPSPNLGWRGLERKGLLERGRPGLVLCLALVHHVAISANVPVREWLDWLAGLGGALVIEFPTREDPMVRRLLAGKRPHAHPDYELGHFEACLERAFRVERRECLESGTRVLYLARPRAGSNGAAPAP